MIRVALLGCGRMGRNHLRTIRENASFELVAVVDPVAEDPGGVPFFRDVAEVAAGFDCAIVATPTATHHAAMLSILRRGLAVLVEKPLARSLEQCRDLVQLAAAADMRLVVGHVERFNPAVGALVSILRDGSLGDPIHFVTTRIGGYPAPTPGTNVVLDLAVHDIDVLRTLIGPLRVEASACHSTVYPSVCDTAEILLTSRRGASATVHVDWIAPTKVRTLRVTASKGAAFVDYVAQTCAVVGHECPRLELEVHKQEPLRAQLNAFARLVETGDPGALCTGSSAMGSVELAERALAASRQSWV